MLYSTISQIVTLLAVGLALVWHQQRSIDKLRKEFQRTYKSLRKEFQRGQRSLRKEFQRGQRSLRKEFQRGQRSLSNELRRDHAELKGVVEMNGQRLARIEGFLGIAMPPQAAANAPGAAYAGLAKDALETPVVEAGNPSTEVGGSGAATDDPTDS